MSIYLVFSISFHPSLPDLLSFTGKCIPASSWPTIPQVYIKGEFIGGIDIMLNMHQSGDLEELLIKEGLIEPDPLSEPVKDGNT